MIDLLEKVNHLLSVYEVTVPDVLLQQSINRTINLLKLECHIEEIPIKHEDLIIDLIVHDCLIDNLTLNKISDKDIESLPVSSMTVGDTRTEFGGGGNNSMSPKQQIIGELHLKRNDIWNKLVINLRRFTW